MRNFFVALVLGMALWSAQAQHLYRCGNNFSQVPCGDDAKPSPSYKGFAAPIKGSEGDRTSAMKAACIQWLRSMPAWKDRDSVKVENVNRGKADVETIDGAPTVIIRYTASVNAKNSYGGYTGEKLAVCYANEQETKIIHGLVFS